RFFYTPLMHSENLADQERCIALCRAAGDVEGVKYAELHADVIRRFGRFPHRNRALGRATTDEERAFLDAGTAGFGAHSAAQERERNRRRITLPVVVIGISSMKATSRGYSCADSLVRTKLRMSAASASEGSCPGLSTMNALTISVRTGSGFPTTAA